MTKARIGIVGVGWWTTTTHIPALQQNPDAELVALADTRVDIMARACDHYHLSARQYTDYNEMLAKEQLDGVIVATNHATHYGIAHACLTSGRHIMLEKPMVLTAKHARDLHALAADKGVELIVGYPWNFTDASRRAREIIRSGELGAIQYVSCLFSSMVIEFLRGDDQKYKGAFGYPVTGPGSVYGDPAQSGGGQGHLQITHSAGAMFFVTGLQPERVSAYMNNLGLRVDVCDAIALRFRAQNGYAAVGVVGSTGNLAMGDSGVNNLQVYCENGRLDLEHMTGSLLVRKHNQTEQRFGPAAPDALYPSYATSQNLVDVILSRAANGSPSEPAVRVVELLDAAYRSAAQDGQPVNVADL